MRSTDPTRLDGPRGGLDDLADAIVTWGIGACEQQVRRFADDLADHLADRLADDPASARRLGASAAILFEILLDTSQAPVARERAFGRLHTLALAAVSVAHRLAA